MGVTKSDLVFPAYDLGDACASPVVASKLKVLGAFFQQGRQLGFLLCRQIGRASGGFAFAQGLNAMLGSAFDPLADRPLRYFEHLRDVFLTVSLTKHFPGENAAILARVVCCNRDSLCGFHVWLFHTKQKLYQSLRGSVSKVLSPVGMMKPRRLRSHADFATHKTLLKGLSTK